MTHKEKIDFMRATVIHGGACAVVYTSLDMDSAPCFDGCPLGGPVGGDKRYSCGTAHQNVKAAGRWLSENDISAKLDLI